MRLHFGQPIKSGQKGLDAELPKGLPPAHIISDALRRKKPEVDRRIQPTVEIDEESYRRYEQWKKEQDRKPSEGGERGVCEIQF